MGMTHGARGALDDVHVGFVVTCRAALLFRVISAGAHLIDGVVVVRHLDGAALDQHGQKGFDAA